MQHIVTIVREMTKQRGRRIVARAGIIEIATNYWRHHPPFTVQAVLLAQPCEQPFELTHPLGA